MNKLSSFLTIVIPAKNEFRNLPGCLDSIKDFQYVVLADSMSTDGTIDLFDKMRKEGNGTRKDWEAVEFLWDGRFPKKRNWVLRNYAFKTPWVLFLDADERLTAAVENELLEVLPQTHFNAFICYYDNWFMGKMLRHGDAMHKTALLRIGAGEYERIEENGWSKLDMEIHEHLIVDGGIGIIRSRFEHHDKRRLESYLAKHEEYANWEAERYRALKGNFSKLTRRQKIKYSLLRRRWFSWFYFCASYFCKGGILDGKAGFWFAWYKRCYFHDIWRKLKEM